MATPHPVPLPSGEGTFWGAHLGILDKLVAVVVVLEIWLSLLFTSPLPVGEGQGEGVFGFFQAKFLSIF